MEQLTKGATEEDKEKLKLEEAAAETTEEADEEKRGCAQCCSLLVFASFMSYVIVGGISYSSHVFVDDLADHFGCSGDDVHRLKTVIIEVLLCSGPIAGILVLQFGCRIVAIAGASIASFGFFISMWAPNMSFLYFSFGCVAGIGFGLIWLSAIVAVANCKCCLTGAIALVTLGSTIGTVVFEFVVRMMLSKYGWQGTLLIETGIILNCIVFGMFLPAVNVTKKLCSFVEMREEMTDGQPVAAALKQIIIYSIFAVSCLLTGMGSLVPEIFLEDAYGLGVYLWKLVVRIFSGVGALLVMIIGHCKCVNRLLFYIKVLVICGIFSIIRAFTSSYVYQFIYAITFGFTTGSYTCLRPIVLIDLFTSKRLPIALGLVQFVERIGALVGPPIAGWVYSISGVYVFSLMGVLYVVGGAILCPTVIQIWRQKRASNKTAAVSEPQAAKTDQETDKETIM